MSAIWTNAMRSGISKESRHQRAYKVGVVEDVICLKSQLQFHVLANGGVLEDRKIKLAEMRPEQGIAAFIAEMASARNAGVGKSVPASGRDRCTELRMT